MMDGFVAAIRQGLDDAGFGHIPIMSYAVKYASAYYGPFRDAAQSHHNLVTEKRIKWIQQIVLKQFVKRNLMLLKARTFLIVKPALSYLDMMRDVKNNFTLPVVAYNVSGEYSMVKAAAVNGWINEEEIVLKH